jgi:hypothetical protein
LQTPHQFRLPTCFASVDITFFLIAHLLLYDILAFTKG